MPPDHILRDEPPPGNQLLVIRGGRDSLSDVNLERSLADCWDEHGFFGVSVFGAPGDDLVTLSEEERQIRRRRQVRLARCGDLRAAGLEVAATFTNPRHFSIVLPDAVATTLTLLRSCFSEPVPNPGFRKD